MPLFEYRCQECRRRFTLLVGMVSEAPQQVCPRCGGSQLQKLISRFSVARSEDDILDSVTDPTLLGDPENPKAVADWMRRVGREMGEELGGDFEELVEEAVREDRDGPPPDSPEEHDGGSTGAPAAAE